MIAEVSQEGSTPLHACCSLQGDHADLVEVLVTHGAEVNAVDRQGMTPLARCAMVGAIQSALWLLQRGADADMQDMHGRTALHIASKHGCTELTALLATFTDVNTVTNVCVSQCDIKCVQQTGQQTGWTSLHYACKYRHPEAAAALVEAGANVNPRTCPQHGGPPLLVAVEQAQDETVKMLLDHGADVTAIDDVRCCCC